MAGEGTMCGQNDLSIRYFKNEKETGLSKTKPLVFTETYVINYYWKWVGQLLANLFALSPATVQKVFAKVKSALFCSH